MSTVNLFPAGKFSVVGALHLPPMPGSQHPLARSIPDVVEFALRNAHRALRVGLNAVYLQDLADFPWSPAVQARTIANLAVIGYALRREFPDLALGVCMMSHGAAEPLAAAQAFSAQFVRLKVYVGSMVKEEGLLQGCAYEAIQERARLGCHEIAILADVYDRSGAPLGRMPLAEEARQAAVFGRADALILTGMNFSESLEMLQEVRSVGLQVPLLLGGGAKPENIQQVMRYAEGAVVSSSFKSVGGWTQQAILAEWDEGLMGKFMKAVRSPQPKEG
jgi:uncharacterized protein